MVFDDPGSGPARGAEVGRPKSETPVEFPGWRVGFVEDSPDSEEVSPCEESSAQEARATHMIAADKRRVIFLAAARPRWLDVCTCTPLLLVICLADQVLDSPYCLPRCQAVQSCW